MRTLVSTVVGGPDQLELQTFPGPAPQAHEVLVDVKACGVNFPDTLIIRDKYQIKPQRPFAPGGEWAGVVAQVGADVTHLKAGDRIAATTLYGGMCEQRVVEDAASRVGQRQQHDEDVGTGEEGVELRDRSFEIFRVTTGGGVAGGLA